MVLVSCCLLERDVHGNVLLTWAYPEVDPDAEPVLKSRSHLVKPTSEDAIEAMGESGSGIDVPATGRESFSKYKQSWIHIITVPTVAGGALPPKVTHVALTLTSDVFYIHVVLFTGFLRHSTQRSTSLLPDYLLSCIYKKELLYTH